jgi:SAM-dependent methyltransferase
VDDETVRRHYEQRVDPDRPGYDIADWADAASQHARFEVLIKHAELAGRALLDVGCGTGDLWAFLAERKIETDYLGVDFAEKVVAEARRRHPAGHFKTIDVFAPGTMAGRQFDVVFASGVFNLAFGDARESLPARIARLLGLARKTVVFNLLHARAAVHYGYCIYWEPAHVLDILAGLPCQAELIDDYLPNDFTIVCRGV